MDDFTLEFLLDALLVYEDENRRDQSPGNFVKSIDAYRLNDSELVEPMDKAFPYLENIQPSYEAEKRKDFYRELYRILEEGGFPNLKSIPRACFPEAQLDLIMARKEQIKELGLRDDPAVEIKRNEILQNLDRFPKLKELRLSFSRTSELMCLEKILSKISSPLKRISVIATNIVVSTPLEDIDHVQPLLDVDNYNIEGPRFLGSGDNVFRYLMKKFPKANDTRMSIEMRDIANVPNYVSPTPTCVVQFLMYLFRMKRDALVNPIVTNSGTKEVVHEFFKQALEENSTRSKKFKLEFTIRLDSNRDESSNNLPYDSYLLAYNRLNDRTLTAAFKVQPDRAPEDCLELFKSVGDMELSSIAFGDNMAFEGLCFTPMPFDRILDYCKKVKKVNFYGIAKPVCSGNFQPPPESVLEKLTFVMCVMTEESLFSISLRSSVKTLIFHNCFYVNPSQSLNSISDPSAFSVTMPDTCLEHLKFFVTVGQESVNVVFKLATKGKKTRYCRILGVEVIEDFEDYDYLLCVNDEDCEVYNLCLEQVTKLTVEMHLTGGRSTKRVVKDYLEEDL